MLYNLISFPQLNIFCVKPADSGLSDMEFEAGCRIVAQHTSKLALMEAMDALTTDELELWFNLIRNALREEEPIHTNFISTRYRKDNWDGERPIY